MRDLENKHILVIGLGISGYASAVFLNQHGARVTVTDMAPEESLAPYAAELRNMGIPMELGQHDLNTVDASDLIVLSPGVPLTIAPVAHALNQGIPVINDIELASAFIEEPIIAITGTNGKTTTTELTEAMLKHCGFKVFTGGNIGTPLITYAGGKRKADIVVLEISSFQLDTIVHFRPHVAVLLNISADHLDRYPDMDAYARSKFRVFKNQQKTDFAILNIHDAYTRLMADDIPSGKYYFGGAEQTNVHAAITDKVIAFSMGTDDRELFLTLEGIRLTGRHNHENIAGAALAVLAMGGNIDGIQSALTRFTAPSHRLEYVTHINGVAYYDDSKATNVDAVARALDAFQENIILIMGGRDKGGDYGILENRIKEKTRLLIVIGESRKLILNCLGHLTKTYTAESLQDAVKFAHKTAHPGDTVLLSPACASFDMFKNYVQRGEQFCLHVKELKEKDFVS